MRIGCKVAAHRNGKWCQELHHCRSNALLLQLHVAMQYDVESEWDGARGAAQRGVRWVAHRPVQARIASARDECRARWRGVACGR